MNDLDAFVAAERLKVKSGYNIRKVSWQGRDGWLKFAVPQKNRRLQRFLQTAAAHLFGLPAFLPAPVSTPRDAIRREAAQIGKWHGLGLAVPALIAQGDDWFISEDSGKRFQEVLKEATPQERRLLLSHAVQALAAAHARGRYHGRPMIKDMAIKDMAAAGDSRVHLLDLEENPGDSMPLTTAQARDWLIFLASALRLGDDALTADLARECLSAATAEARDEIEHIVARTRILRKIAGCLPRAWLGAEIASGISLLQALDTAD